MVCTFADVGYKPTLRTENVLLRMRGSIAIKKTQSMHSSKHAHAQEHTNLIRRKSIPICAEKIPPEKDTYEHYKILVVSSNLTDHQKMLAKAMQIAYTSRDDARDPWHNERFGFAAWTALFFARPAGGECLGRCTDCRPGRAFLPCLAARRRHRVSPAQSSRVEFIGLNHFPPLTRLFHKWIILMASRRERRIS